MLVTFPIDQDGVSTMVVKSLQTPKISATFRHMIEDLGGCDDSIEMPFTPSQDPIHPGAFDVITKLCEHLTENDITLDNWKEKMITTSSTNDDSLGKYINDLMCEYTSTRDEKRALFHDVLNIANYLEIDNNQPHPSGCYVLEILCAQYAFYMLK